MDIALVAAKILGTYLIVSGLFLIFRGKTVPHLLKDFFDHPAVMYLAGAMLIFLSSAYLSQSNVWDGTWRTVLTIFAWLVLIKGVGYILMPDALHKAVSRKVLESLNLYGLVAMAMGLALFYVG
ncbi:hypothetical protein HYV30_00625 [Candidatus Kaiserbacteria bacterium]|nr:hypothetical protein [Candidatus Kaiserbacteria bacterium]